MPILKRKRILKIAGSLFFLAGLFAGVAIFANAGQKDHLIYSHQKHVDEIGVDCTTCHTKVDSSLKGTDNLLPDMETCFQCHDGESAPNKCTLCHTNPDEATVAPRITNYSPKFPHQTHLQAGEKCLTCHVGILKATDTAARHLPKMNQCQACHQQKQVSDPLKCQVCHTSKENLQPITHKLEWKHAHQFAAESNPKDCAQCHAQTYCENCHEGKNLTHRTHPLNYEWNHAIDAKMNKTQCISCHEDEVFCIQCHQEKHVMPPSHGRVDWANRIDGGQHKIEAEFDLESCLACHGDYKTYPTCFSCHNQPNKEE